MKTPEINLSFIQFHRMAKYNDKEELLKLIEIIFYIIVNCTEKEGFIRKILGLDATVQEHLRKIIETVMRDEYKEQLVSKGQNSKIIDVDVSIPLEEYQMLKKERIDHSKVIEQQKYTIDDLQREISKSTNVLVNCKVEKVRDKKDVIHIFELERRISIYGKELSCAEDQKAVAASKYEKKRVKLREQLDLVKADQTKIMKLGQETKSLQSDLAKLKIMKENHKKLKTNFAKSKQELTECKLSLLDYADLKREIFRLRIAYSKREKRLDHMNNSLSNKNEKIQYLLEKIRELKEKRYEENLSEDDDPVISTDSAVNEIYLNTYESIDSQSGTPVFFWLGEPLQDQFNEKDKMNIEDYRSSLYELNFKVNIAKPLPKWQNVQKVLDLLKEDLQNTKDDIFHVNAQVKYLFRQYQAQVIEKSRELHTIHENVVSNLENNILHSIDSFNFEDPSRPKSELINTIRGIIAISKQQIIRESDKNKNRINKMNRRHSEFQFALEKSNKSIQDLWSQITTEMHDVKQSIFSPKLTRRTIKISSLYN